MVGSENKVIPEYHRFLNIFLSSLLRSFQIGDRPCLVAPAASPWVSHSLCATGSEKKIRESTADTIFYLFRFSVSVRAGSHSRPFPQHSTRDPSHNIRLETLPTTFAHITIMLHPDKSQTRTSSLLSAKCRSSCSSKPSLLCLSISSISSIVFSPSTSIPDSSRTFGSTFSAVINSKTSRFRLKHHQI